MIIITRSMTAARQAWHGRSSWELIVESTNTKQRWRGTTGMGRALETSKPIPSVTLPLTSSHLLILLNQFCKLGTKHSYRWAYGGNSRSNLHTSPRSPHFLNLHKHCHQLGNKHSIQKTMWDIFIEIITELSPVRCHRTVTPQSYRQLQKLLVTE